MERASSFRDIPVSSRISLMAAERMGSLPIRLPDPEGLPEGLTGTVRLGSGILWKEQHGSWSGMLRITTQVTASGSMARNSPSDFVAAGDPWFFW